MVWRVFSGSLPSAIPINTRDSLLLKAVKDRSFLICTEKTVSYQKRKV
jgi:hypothetical protein